MAATIQATGAPAAGIARVMGGTVPIATRREGRVEPAPGAAARELDAEVTRLLRVRGGELAEPLLWERPSHRSQVDTIVMQLAPIRSRIALLSSWERESRRGSAVRLAYAIVWLRLGQRRAGEYGPHRRPRLAKVPLRGCG